MPHPVTMRHVDLLAPGGPEQLAIAEGPTPKPGPGEVLIRVAAAGVNRPDVVQREGRYPPPPGASAILGLEVAGTIVALGPEAGDWRIGDAVCALVAGGGYAEYCVAPALQCLPVPSGFSMVQAAAIPETFFTVWANVFDRGRLACGETFLVHGGTSGIGTTAIQLASAIGARVFTTAGSPEKCEACLKLGAEAAIDYREQDFVEAIKRLTDGAGVDLVLDMVGGPYVQRNLQALAAGGRLVQIAFLQGSRVEVDLLPIMLKRLTVTGSTLRSRPVEEKGQIAKALHDHVWPMLESGLVAPVLYQTFPLAEAAEAHRLMESSRHIGKIVLTLEGSVHASRRLNG
ncbi:MAG: NAD(P)H-quinone oxidoreductase [Candidatus Sericytochromatia bacterium]